MVGFGGDPGSVDGRTGEDLDENNRNHPPQHDRSHSGRGIPELLGWEQAAVHEQDGQFSCRQGECIEKVVDECELYSLVVPYQPLIRSLIYLHPLPVEIAQAGNFPGGPHETRRIQLYRLIFP